MGREEVPPMHALLLAILLAAQSAGLPVYMADGTVRHAKAPASFAFGRAVWHDVELDRIVQLPVAALQLEQTRAVHEAARDEMLAAGAPGASLGTVSYVGGGGGGAFLSSSRSPAPSDAAEGGGRCCCPASTTAVTPTGAAPPIRTMSSQERAVERARARDAYARAQADYLRAAHRVETAPTPGEALLRYGELAQAGVRLATGAARLKQATASR